MAKKLRLAAAGLTDVGRRRERNQDNVAHFVPEDEDVLAKRGALFVVCDGMGGHAAGEVAAEIGVNTLRDVYYASDSTASNGNNTSSDIITGLANAIKQANQSIFQFAREHSEMTGMGTTCVAVVMQGGRAYFLNIGDSRGYLVRGGQMRQVTLDHSWVAEQVRAGLLTEEQARTHAHRNVITRSLGTQPNVSADLFIERLQDGDRVLLCSDGLHGYVDETEIEQAVQADMNPDDIAQSLINMANENGGPDNITAIIVNLLEVPEATGEVQLPEDIVGEEQIITQPIPAMPRTTMARALIEPDESSGLEIPEASLRPLPSAPASKRKRPNRAAVVAIRLLAVAALVLLCAGIWDFSFGPYALERAAATQMQNDIQQAQQVAQQAQTQPPEQALTSLAQARQRIENDLQNPNLDTQSRQNAQNALNSQITPAVQSSVQRYNTNAHIQPVSPSGVTQYTVSCTVPGQQTPSTLTSATSLITVAAPPSKSGPPTTQIVYAISGGQLDQVLIALDASGAPVAGSGTAPCFAVSLPGAVSTVVALAADGTTLYALVQQGTSAYAVLSITTSGTNPNGSPHTTTLRRFSVPGTSTEVPTSLAEGAGTFYVGYKGGAAAGGIWTFTGASPKAPAQTISLSQSSPAVLAFSNKTLYALLADGSLGQLDSSRTYLPLPVQVQPPLSIIDPSAYSAGSPVPTASPGTNSATTTQATASTFADGATLTADPALSGHVLVGDGASNRIVRFIATTGTPGLEPAAQYVYTAPLAHGAGLALASNGAALTAYTWNGAQLATFSVAEPVAG